MTMLDFFGPLPRVRSVICIMCLSVCSSFCLIPLYSIMYQRVNKRGANSGDGGGGGGTRGVVLLVSETASMA